MLIHDNRAHKWLINPPDMGIMKLNSGDGSVSATLYEGYTVTIDYSEIEQLFNAMDGYTGKLQWRKEV